VDRAQLGRDRVPVCAGRVLEAVPEQVDHTRLDRCVFPGRSDAFWDPL
jgi:hypothetical protein